MTLKMDRRTFLGGAAALGARMLAAKQPFEDTTSWDPFVPNIADEATYLRRKFRQDVTDKATGLDIAGLKKLLREIVASGKAAGESWRVTKAKCFAALCTRQSIDVSPFDWFPAIACWDRHDLPMHAILGARAAEIREKFLPKEMERSRRNSSIGAWGCGLDYCHSVPEWHAILPIGFPEGTAADGLRRLDVPVARVLLRRPRQDRAGQVHRPRRGDHEVSLRV